MNNSEILIYQDADGKVRIDVRLEEETVWLTQAHLCDLFQKSKATISEHISHIFQEGELSEESVVRNFRTTAADGKSYDVRYYNLDVIISVGYRVKSHQGTQFRIWATQRLKEYIVKGFALKKTNGDGAQYFRSSSFIYYTVKSSLEGYHSACFRLDLQGGFRNGAEDRKSLPACV